MFYSLIFLKGPTMVTLPVLPGPALSARRPLARKRRLRAALRFPVLPGNLIQFIRYSLIFIPWRPVAALRALGPVRPVPRGARTPRTGPP
jgi:hypothetical protein